MDPRIAGRRRAVAESRARDNLRRLSAVLGVAGVAVVTLWLFRSPFLSVSELVVRGTKVVDARATLAEFGIVAGRPLIEIDPGEVEVLLLADPWVARATVVRDWPDRLVVEVVERVPAGWVEATDGWVRVASDGTVLESGTPPDGEPRVVGAGVVAAEVGKAPRIVAAAAFLAALGPDYSAGAVVDVGGEEITAVVAGYPARLGLPAEMAEKARSLAAVLATGPEAGSQITVVAPSRPAVLPP